jgi:hypothetical protein
MVRKQEPPAAKENDYEINKYHVSSHNSHNIFSKILSKASGI